MGILFDKYLIDMNKEEDALVWRWGSKPDRIGWNGKFTPAFFPDGRDEIGESVMSATSIEPHFHNKFHEIFYHEHLDGEETFFVTDGDYECITLGEKMVIHPGDIIHVQPWMGHGFRPLSKYCRMLIMFQSKDMRFALERRKYLNEHHADVAATPEFKKQQMADQHDQLRDGSYYYDTAPTTTTSPAYRRFGQGIRSHEFPGIKLNLMIARYETHGIKEVWEYEMKKGVRIENDAVRYDHRLFWCREGEIKFNIDGEEFTAKPNCLIYVPPYHTFTLETETDADLADLSCPYELQDLLEELRLIQCQYPEKLKDDAVMNELFERFKADRVKYSYNG